MIDSTASQADRDSIAEWIAAHLKREEEAIVATLPDFDSLDLTTPTDTAIDRDPRWDTFEGPFPTRVYEEASVALLSFYRTVTGWQVDAAAEAYTDAEESNDEPGMHEWSERSEALRAEYAVLTLALQIRTGETMKNARRAGRLVPSSSTNPGELLVNLLDHGTTAPAKRTASTNDRPILTSAQHDEAAGAQA